MRLAVAVVLAGLLAGCSARPAAPTPHHDAQTGPPSATRAAIDAYVEVYPWGCGPVSCWGNSTNTLFQAADNQSIKAVSLDVATSQMDSAFRWALACHTTDDDDRCARPLATGRDAPPFHVDASGLDLPTGALLLFWIARDTPDPLLGIPIAFLGANHVTGNVTLAEEPRSTFDLVEVPVSLDGQSGPCALFVDPDCTGVPGGTQKTLSGIHGTVVAANLTMTWTSLTPADRVLRFVLYPARCVGSCPRPAEAHGPSPLQLTNASMYFERGVTVAVFQGDPTGADSTGIAFEFAGTRTPVHLEGDLTVRLDRGEGKDSG